MVRVEDLMAAIQNDLAAEYAKALNKAKASVKVADAKAVVVPLVKYIQTYIPEMDLGEVTDADLNEAAEFLVSAIDEELKLLKTPKAKLNIDPIADFLKEMGL